MRDQDMTRPQLLEELVRLREERQADEALRDSHRMLQALIDASPESILLIAADGKVLHANRTTACRLGKSIDKIIGRVVYGLLPPDVAECRKAVVDAVVRTGKPMRFEDRRLERDIENVVYPILDAQGQVFAVAALGIDQTDRKQAQEALRRARNELEEQVKQRTAELAVFQKFAEASGGGFGMADLEGNILYVNPALCRLFGEKKPEDVIGKHVSTYYPGGYEHRRETEILPALVREGFWQGEQAILSRTGRLIPTLQYNFLICDDAGEPIRIAATVADITEIKQAQEALRASERRFRSYFEQGLMGMAVSGPDMRWIEVNDRLCAMLLYTADELRGMVWKDVTHPDDLQRNLDLQERVQAGAIDYYTIDKRFFRKGGAVMYATVFVRCFRRQDGSVDHFLALIEDSTQRRLAQDSAERERQSLWKMLQASDHERQLISYEIHDGLAQYLAAAGMQFQAYEALRKAAPPEARKAYKTAVELVRQAHFEARRLISEVRPPVIDEIGLETAISHLVHERRRPGDPKITFHSDVQFHRLPAILENSLYRIAQEALTNACRHSKSRRAEVTLVQHGQEVRLDVRDWGVGFDPASVEKGHFGLEGIRQRVRLLGGRVSVRSTPGTGTTIEVSVPILEKQTDAQAIEE